MNPSSRLLSSAVLASLVASAPFAALGADEQAATIAALLKRIEELEHKVANLEHPASTASSPAPSATTSSKTDAAVQDLQQQVKVLKRQNELATDAAAEKAQTAPVVSIGAQGFQVRSADTNFAFKLRGLVQADTRWLINNGGGTPAETFLLRRARLISEGTFFRDFDYQLVTEFGGGNATAQSPTILDANVSYRVSPALSLKAGKFKSPVGLEVLQSDRDRSFIESALPSQLIPNRDIGFQASGDFFDGRLSYAAGVFNGSSDATSANNTDIEGKKEFAGRVFTNPFASSSNEWAQGLGFGLGGSYGNAETASNLPNGGRGTYVSDSQQAWFTYKSGIAGDTTGVVTDGPHWRLSPQGYYYFRSFGVLGEYAVSDQRYRAGNGTAANPFKFAYLDNTAWQVAVSYVLTGEASSYKSVTPRHNLNPAEGNWGAFEVVARYSELDIDSAAFGTFADPTKSPHAAHAVTVGLNWYPNRIFRASVNYTLTDYDGGNGATGDKRSENLILTRFQVAF